MKGTRIRLWKVLRVPAGLLYVLVLMELYLRFFAPVAIMPRYVCENEYGIRGNVPNSRYWQKTPECRVLIRTNSKGLRADREIPYKKTEGVYRIVVLGDSYGMGYEVNLEDTFPSQLAGMLEEAGWKTEIVNLSVSGHGNAEEYIMLTCEGFKYEPDLVLLQWHSTDLLDNVRSGLFALQDGVLVRRNQSYLPGIAVSKVLYRIPGYRFLSENSQLYSFIREWTAMKIKDLLAFWRGRQAVLEEGDTSPAQSVQQYREELTAALLAKMQEECRQRNIPFLVLDIPRVHGRTEFRSVFPMEKVSSLQLDYYSPIQDFLRYAGRKIFTEKGHFHLTPLGCRIVARGLADYILAKHWPQQRRELPQ